MGVNIYIGTVTGDDHPDWDSYRYGGDREWARRMGTEELPAEQMNPAWDPWLHGDDENPWRPVDLPRWRTAIASEPEDFTRARMTKFLDLIEADPCYGYWLSY